MIAIGVPGLVGIVCIPISQKKIKLNEFRLINIFLLGSVPKKFSKMQLLRFGIVLCFFGILDNILTNC